MRSFVTFCLLSVVAVTLARPDHYTDRYDNRNLDEILINRRLLIAYVKCIYDECAPDAKELEHIHKGLKNEGGKCTNNGTRKL